MSNYLFKRLYQLMGPLKSYLKEDNSHHKAENAAFEKIAEELSRLFDENVTFEKVMMQVYSTAMMSPVLNPSRSWIDSMSAALESKWFTNVDINRARKYFDKNEMMIDMGDYWAVRKKEK